MVLCFLRAVSLFVVIRGDDPDSLLQATQPHVLAEYREESDHPEKLALDSTEMHVESDHADKSATARTLTHWDFLKNLQGSWKDLLGAFDLDKLKAQMGDVLGKVSKGEFSMDDVQKLGNLTKTLSQNLNKTVGQMELEIKDVKSKAKSLSQKAKVGVLQQVTEKAVKAGRAAMQVIASITEAIEKAQVALSKFLAAVKSAKTEKEAGNIYLAFNIKLKALKELANKLMQAMNRENLVVSLLSAARVEVTDSSKDLPAIAVKAQREGTAALESSQKVHDVAKTYVGFVNKTLNEAEAKVLLLSNQTANSAAGNVDAHVDQVFSELMALLENGGKMLKGKYDLAKAKIYVKSGAQGLAAPLSLLGLLFGVVIRLEA